MKSTPRQVAACSLNVRAEGRTNSVTPQTLSD